MTVKIRSTIKPQTASSYCSGRDLAVQYKAVLSLRAAVRQAELLAVKSISKNETYAN